MKTFPKDATEITSRGGRMKQRLSTAALAAVIGFSGAAYANDSDLEKKISENNEPKRSIASARTGECPIELCPLFPKDPYHWLNLEYRAGDIAPELKDNMELINDLRVIEKKYNDEIKPLFEKQNLGTKAKVTLKLQYYIKKTRSVQQPDGTFENLVESTSPRDLMIEVVNLIDGRLIRWYGSNG
ncbi:MAG: hypothetical protein DRJ15_14715, partial [Bacteroidetes bacterium]